MAAKASELVQEAVKIPLEGARPETAQMFGVHGVRRFWH